MNNKSYPQFVNIFSTLVFRLLKYQRVIRSRGRILKNVYTHSYNLDKVCYSIYLQNNTPDKYVLLKKWLKFTMRDYDIQKFLEISYENVHISDLDKYIKILCSQRLGRRWQYISDPIKLLKISKQAINLTFDEFLFILSVKLSSIHMVTFRELIRTINNQNISDLWELWKNYENMYSNYIEWLPRETLEDLIMVQNGGKYMPSYESFME